MASRSQIVLQLPKKGGSYVVGTRPIPNPSSGELIIKVQAVALNPIDWIIQENGFFLKEEDYPVILGFDTAGVVESVGEGVQGFSIGDRVAYYGYFNEEGGFQQYTKAFAHLVAKIPDSLSFSQASTLPCCVVTAAIGIFSDLGAGINPNVETDKNLVKSKGTGQSAFVVGGSSSVGQFALQLLKFAGFSTIITYASSRHSDYVKSLGATHIIDRGSVKAQDIPSEVKKIVAEAGTSPVSVVFDAIGLPETQEASYKVLAAGPGGGTLASTKHIEVKDIDESKKIKTHGIFSFLNEPEHKEFGPKIMGGLGKLVENGAIVPSNVEELPNGLAGVVEGLDRLKNGKVSASKLIVLPQEVTSQSQLEEKISFVYSNRVEDSRTAGDQERLVPSRGDQRFS